MPEEVVGVDGLAGHNGDDLVCSEAFDERLLEGKEDDIRKPLKFHFF